MNALTSPLLVTCLCAEWCGTCRDYRALFDSVATRWEGQAQFLWIDIEDDAELLGDLDIETFPTLLIADRDAPLFFGPLTPRANVLARTVANAIAGELRPIADAEIRALTHRIHRHNE